MGERLKTQEKTTHQIGLELGRNSSGEQSDQLALAYAGMIRSFDFEGFWQEAAEIFPDSVLAQNPGSLVWRFPLPFVGWTKLDMPINLFRVNGFMRGVKEAQSLIDH